MKMPADPRKCRKCGSELPEDANFCPKCGAPVRGVVKEEFSVPSSDLVRRVKELIHEGNVNRIVVKDEKGNLLLDIPVTAGLVGTLLAPWLAALGVIAALFTKCAITIERREPTQ